VSRQKRHDLPWTLDSATGKFWTIRDAKGRAVARYVQESTAKEIVSAVTAARAANTTTPSVECKRCDRDLMPDECIVYDESPVKHCPGCYEALS